MEQIKDVDTEGHRLFVVHVVVDADALRAEGASLETYAPCAQSGIGV
jgi:hypothetical protein